MKTSWISTIGDSHYRELAPGIKLTVTRRILTKDDKNPPYQAFFNRLVLKKLFESPQDAQKAIEAFAQKTIQKAMDNLQGTLS